MIERLKNATRKLLFNFKIREIEIKKTCVLKHGCHGSVKLHGQ